ncbi:MAG TPA: PDZ domain-containing protein [Marmoricola sp.]|nr:PDZ domain-containing protein [Marmoricola sp.]
MSRRSAAGLLAVGLLLVLVVVAGMTSVPYVTVSPGPTIDVLGEEGDEPIVDIDGTKTYPTKGQMRLTTVSVTNPENQLNLGEALLAWLGQDVAVLPYKAMYPEPTSNESERAESAAKMVSSQDAATAAALGELGEELPTYAEVLGVTPDGPSVGKLEARDRLLSVAGEPTEDVDDVLAALDSVEPGEKVEVEVRRKGEERTVTITTAPGPDDPEQATLGVLVGTGYEFPFDVRVHIDESIGGPSAGLMFALSIYDTLTPGALNGGEVIAGTGTITAEGDVGPIGGIAQKIAGAEESGASLFFVPPDNCDTVLAADLDEDGMRLVRADTLHSAVEALKKYVEDPSVELPRCAS